MQAKTQTLLHFSFFFLGGADGTQALYMPGPCSTAELLPSPTFELLMKTLHFSLLWAQHNSSRVNLSSFFFFFFFLWDWGLNLGLCKTGTLLFEPHLQSVGYFGNGVLRTIFVGWPGTVILLISTFQVVRITGVSHWCPASKPLLYRVISLFWQYWGWIQGLALARQLLYQPHSDVLIPNLV
jgi:hypothetical protein